MLLLQEDILLKCKEELKCFLEIYMTPGDARDNHMGKQVKLTREEFS